MKGFFAFILFSAFAIVCNAQYISINKPKYRIVHRDTINIKGVIYDYLGRPVTGAQILSKNNELTFDGFYVYTSTDLEGKFVLNGALVTDTLEIHFNKVISVINKGSRYLEIHLPPVTEDVAPPLLSTEVTAKRMVKKKATSTFKVITNAMINDYYGINGYFEYPAASPKQFVDDVKAKVIYPKKAIDNNIEGEVVIGFTIEKDGTLLNFKTIRSIGYGCEEAVINAIKTSYHWKPAGKNGRPVLSESSMAIDFKLEDR